MEKKKLQKFNLFKIKKFSSNSGFSLNTAKKESHKIDNNHFTKKFSRR